MPGPRAIDLDTGPVGLFGDGERPIEVTSIADTARMTARVALDRNVSAGKFGFAGDKPNSPAFKAIATGLILGSFRDFAARKLPPKRTT